MSKKKPKSERTRGKSRGVAAVEAKRKDGKSASPQQASRGLWPSAAAWRDIIESVVIALMLAFLFRTFEAEAFVIPTGSMAPTLLGRHKDAACPKCGYRVRVSASDEVNNNTGRLTGEQVVACTCPMCGYTMQLDRHNPQGEDYPSYKGDRILVAKFPYQFGEPKRFDVAVFKYPGGAKTNFIKRIVGLPNETILISHGDLFVKPVTPEDFDRFGRPPDRYDHVANTPVDLEPEFEIARKPPNIIKAMVQPVYDNDHVLPELIEAGWPARWAPLDGENPAGGWIASDDDRSFSTDGSAEGVVRLAYRHVVPSYDDWLSLQDGLMPPGNPRPKPQLIRDLSAYNTKVLSSVRFRWGMAPERQDARGLAPYGASPRDAVGPVPNPRKLGLHWVGDLAVECEIKVESERGEAIVELIEGGSIFQCRIDVATGRATLSVDGLDDFHPTAQTDVCRPGSYRIMFVNIDDQLLLWVGRKVVRFDTATTYPRLGNRRPQPEDLRPVRIGSREAALQISHLKIHRDIYYIAQRLAPGTGGSSAITDFLDDPSRSWTGSKLALAYSDPQQWDFFAATRQVAFPLRGDQFLVLGDNSAESRDSRLWENEYFDYYVGRELLIGKALVIYWPHGWDIPGTNLPIKIAPNFGRILRFVR